MKAKAKLKEYEWPSTTAKVFARNVNGVCHYRKGGHMRLEDMIYHAIGKINSKRTEMEFHIAGPTATTPFHIELRCFNVGTGVDYEILHRTNISPEKAAEYADEALLGFKETAFRKGGGPFEKNEALYFRNATMTSETSKANLRDAVKRMVTTEKMALKVEEFQYGTTRYPTLQ